MNVVSRAMIRLETCDLRHHLHSRRYYIVGDDDGDGMMVMINLFIVPFR